MTSPCGKEGGRGKEKEGITHGAVRGEEIKIRETRKMTTTAKSFCE